VRQIRPFGLKMPLWSSKSVHIFYAWQRSTDLARSNVEIYPPDQIYEVNFIPVPFGQVFFSFRPFVFSTKQDPVHELDNYTTHRALLVTFVVSQVYFRLQGRPPKRNNGERVKEKNTIDVSDKATFACVFSTIYII